MSETGLRKLGFTEIVNRRIWIHHGLRKSISHQVARDANLLQKALAEQTDAGEFWFYRASEPDDNRKNIAEEHFKIMREIGLPHLQPLIRLGTFAYELH